jgi:hypothetical protein
MVSCRVLTESPESTRLEWRVPGADVDPYLAIAALIASARDGIETDAEPGEPLVGRDYDRPVRPPPEAIERFRDGGSHLRPSVRTWWRISRRRADGSGSSSCPLARSASGSEGATSTSSEEVVA